jgi:hypothetical protein
VVRAPRESAFRAVRARTERRDRASPCATDHSIRIRHFWSTTLRVQHPCARGLTNRESSENGAFTRRSVGQHPGEGDEARKPMVVGVTPGRTQIEVAHRTARQGLVEGLARVSAQGRSSGSSGRLRTHQPVSIDDVLISRVPRHSDALCDAGERTRATSAWLSRVSPESSGPQVRRWGTLHQTGVTDIPRISAVSPERHP